MYESEVMPKVIELSEFFLKKDEKRKKALEIREQAS